MNTLPKSPAADAHSKSVRYGTVFWITGLSGAGKTTIAKILQQEMRTDLHNPIVLDGDVLREIFGARHGYSREDRLSLAHMYGRLCRELAHQGADVICATISMFHEVREWNKANIEKYIEIYLRVPHEERSRRDPKGFYASAQNGNLTELAGVDQTVEEPLSPDLVIENHTEMSAEKAASIILQYISKTNGDTKNEN